MTIEKYLTAIRKINANDIEIYPQLDDLPTKKELIEELEKRLLVSLPLSYRKMLEDFGILGFEGQTFYGLGKLGLDGKGGSGVVFQTEVARGRGQISENMVRILSSGYGPEFVIDCAQMDADGEAPVFEVAASGYKDGMKKVADSFGEFLLNEVNMLLEET